MKAFSKPQTALDADRALHRRLGTIDNELITSNKIDLKESVTFHMDLLEGKKMEAYMKFASEINSVNGSRGGAYRMYQMLSRPPM